jgi:4-hydroxy-tetrahydrodipicolinate synthase
VYPAICTPFTVDGAVDLDAQRRVVRFALDCGSHGIVAFGLAGEVLKLSPDERRALTDVIVDEVGGSVPVFIGAGAPSIRASVELARHAEQAGASCIVLPAPMGGSVGEAALVDYFVRVASSVSIPVMVQDAPAYLGVGLGPELVRRIGAAAENVRLVKLEAGPVEIGDWIVSLGDEFAIWGGDGGMYLLDCIRSGAAGIIPGVDLVDHLVEVYEADARGESSLADERFREILPVLVFEMQHSIDHYNTCAKRVLVRRGVLENPDLRPPAATFAAVSHTLLDRHLSSLQIAAGGARVD